jgi:hypothetical protein
MRTRLRRVFPFSLLNTTTIRQAALKRTKFSRQRPWTLTRQPSEESSLSAVTPPASAMPNGTPCVVGGVATSTPPQRPARPAVLLFVPQALAWLLTWLLSFLLRSVAAQVEAGVLAGVRGIMWGLGAMVDSWEVDDDQR